jgi:hypothetical protein
MWSPCSAGSGYRAERVDLTQGVVLDSLRSIGPPVQLGWRLENGARTLINSRGSAF